MYKCEVCSEKQYCSQKALNKHNRIIHGLYSETFYACDTCKELFTNKCKLKIHLRLHKQLSSNARRIHTCEYCEKVYLSQDALQKHFKQKHIPESECDNAKECLIQHPDKYLCHDCGLTFIKRKDIISHVKVHREPISEKIMCPQADCSKVDLQSLLTEDHEQTEDQTNVHSLINSKLEMLLGLNKKITLSKDTACNILKYLDEVIDIYNSSQTSFHCDSKEIVNVNKNIHEQHKFYSTKKKQKKECMPNPSVTESEYINRSISNPDGHALNIHTGFDHNYA